MFANIFPPKKTISPGTFEKNTSTNASVCVSVYNAQSVRNVPWWNRSTVLEITNSSHQRFFRFHFFSPFPVPSSIAHPRHPVLRPLNTRPRQPRGSIPPPCLCTKLSKLPEKARWPMDILAHLICPQKYTVPYSPQKDPVPLVFFLILSEVTVRSGSVAQSVNNRPLCAVCLETEGSILSF